MPTIHKSLILDHLFFSASPEQFDELKAIFLQFQSASHQHVKADDDSWEGLYIYNRSQFYLEILRARRSECMGLCQKAIYPLSQDARHIVHDFPNLPWKSFERSMNGKKWFSTVACDNYLDLKTPFNTWVMHYYQRDTEYQGQFPKYEMQTFFEVEAVADSNLRDRILLNSEWFNAKRTVTPDEICFDFQTFYSDPMKLKIELKAGAKGIQFKKLKFQLVPGIEMPGLNALKMKYYKLTKLADHYVLESLHSLA